MKLPGIEEKVAFLSRPESYPGHVERVEWKQTHMSWVFLTDMHAWKLKKPVRTEYLDFSTTELRRRNARREVRLNRRLAKDVYRGVVPLALDRDGKLQLGAEGKYVDWLVLMRRLPAHRMLDYLIAEKSVLPEDLLNVASLLADFYKELPPASVTEATYRERLTLDLEKARKELLSTGNEIPANIIEPAIQLGLEFLRRNTGLFDARVRAGKIVEGHGDLRPEHICLESQPVIIDCLEFNRTLRTLDTVSELAFLALECERLGAPDIGTVFLRRYGDATGDWPSSELLAFYRSYHVCIRAKVAASHLIDNGIHRPLWIAKAKEYLEMAQSMNMAA